MKQSINGRAGVAAGLRAFAFSSIQTPVSVQEAEKPGNELLPSGAGKAANKDDPVPACRPFRLEGKA
ncbi:hypothetical protein [Paraburkholderia sp.]|uniref:hypothetical protein n=1 Tax=Paraburkholderia sp. TaxID=1926495 RepID=UPI0025EFBEE5|nr:hypothetical protein [Paraburkholderia sp.]